MIQGKTEMDDNQIAAAIPTGQALATSQGASQTKARPFAIAQIASCLALVRPVGMSDGMAEEWVRIASRDLHAFPDRAIAAACQKARMICNHHGKILPTVIEECERITAEVARKREYDALPKERAGETAHVYPTLQELENHIRWLNGAGQSQQKLRSTGLSLGALIMVEDGRVHPAPGCWKYADGNRVVQWRG